ncbi:MAG: M20/M25/M40 family metallo-hydrolase [Alphaproteobacteria bacterium]|nr:M20/M25/M40 family metallo-hydrolase [Alphaproteobacteria bacterium]
MDLLKTIQDLIKIRTVTGNKQEIKHAAEYIKNTLSHTDTIVEIFQTTASPVIFLRNTDSIDFDVVILGHIDVVPAPDDMFEPKIKDGKMYGRGTLDMKSFAAVALNSMEYVVTHKLPIKFGVILSTDEEQGSLSTESFMDAYPNISARIVLDNDVGGDITKIVSKCKNPVFVKLISTGKEAHGSTPWDGIDANELLMKTWQNIRKIYPYYSADLPQPQNKWFDTVHFATISGGLVSNIISNHAEALLDFRLTENSSVENLENNLQKCMEKGVSYQIVSASTPVVMSEDDPDILDYKRFAENIMGKPIEFEHIGGATDSRSFAVKGSTVIMHSGTGEGMHATGEYVNIESVKQIADIQIKFLEHLARKHTS